MAGTDRTKDNFCIGDHAHCCHLLSKIAVMLALGHPDPRFRAWAGQWLGPFWGREHFFNGEPDPETPYPRVEY